MHSLLSLQAFLGLLTVTMLLLVAGLAQIDDLTDALRGRLDARTGESVDAKQRMALLTSLVVHDIRSPILAMRNGLGVAEKAMSGPRPDHHGVLEVIRESQSLCSTLAWQIESLLRGDREHDPDRKIALTEVMDRSLALVQVATKNSIALEKSGLYGISITRSFEIERIFVVILSNAYKFASSQVVVRAEIMLDSQLIMSIIDDGPGLRTSSENNESTFDDKQDGIGIGLDLAQEQARKLGILISRGDNFQGGALFKVVIPANFVSIAEAE